MDFFDTIYFENSVRNYCIVGSTILLVILLKRYLSRYIASLIFRLTNRIWKGLDKQSFFSLLVDPLEWLLFLLIAVFSIDKLNFPAVLNYRIYGHGTDEIISRTGIGIIIIAFSWFLLRIIDFIGQVFEKRASLTLNKSDDQLVVFFRDFLKVIIIIVGFLLLLKACFKQPVGNLLTSLSIIGAVLALAAKESLENLIASFIIFFDKPFITGDTLKVNTITGTVERIGLRSTRIRTLDKTLVTVPNKQMVDSVVDNWTMRTHLRAEIRLGFSSNTPTQTTTDFISDARKMLVEKTGISSFSVYLTDLNKNGLHVMIEFFTASLSWDDFNQLKEDVNIALKELMDEKDIQFSVDFIFKQ